jgi:hypothetical protein
MQKFTLNELRQRAFLRASWVLQHYWEEQQYDTKSDGRRQDARVHSRLFDPLVPDIHITIGQSKKGGGHKEHLVPCVVLRDHAFAMFWDRKTVEDVAEMLQKFLRIAHIHPEEARHLDHALKLKKVMPVGWSFDSGSVMARLEAGGIELVLADIHD